MRWNSVRHPGICGLKCRQLVPSRFSVFDGGMVWTRIGCFIERRPQGDYAVRKPNSDRASVASPYPGKSNNRSGEEINPGVAIGGARAGYRGRQAQTVAQAVVSRFQSARSAQIDAEFQIFTIHSCSRGVSDRRAIEDGTKLYALTLRSHTGIFSGTTW